MSGQQVTVHDFRTSFWGHGVTDLHKHRGLDKAKFLGHGGRIRKGDYIAIASVGGDLVYRVDTISYYSDPKDMWKGEFTKTTLPEDVLAEALDRANRPAMTFTFDVTR